MKRYCNHDIVPWIIQFKLTLLLAALFPRWRGFDSSTQNHHLSCGIIWQSMGSSRLTPGILDLTGLTNVAWESGLATTRHVLGTLKVTWYFCACDINRCSHLWSLSHIIKLCNLSSFSRCSLKYNIMLEKHAKFKKVQLAITIEIPVHSIKAGRQQ